MTDTALLTRYVSDLRRYLSPHLKPGIALETYVHPARETGAVIEIRPVQGGLSRDQIAPEKNTVLEILTGMRQNFVHASPGSNIRFGGTNIYLDPEKILLIKGEDSPNVWNGDAAQDDVKRLVRSMSRQDQQ